MGLSSFVLRDDTFVIHTCCLCVSVCSFLLLSNIIFDDCIYLLLGYVRVDFNLELLRYLDILNITAHILLETCFSFLETCTYRCPLEEMCDFVQSCHTAFGNEMYIVAFSSVVNALLILSSTSLILHFVLPASDASPL